MYVNIGRCYMSSAVVTPERASVRATLAKLLMLIA